jgi:predicted short-subunit dehydrogenase-like oxidoreductase (DUF2520 family)
VDRNDDEQAMIQPMTAVQPSAARPGRLAVGLIGAGRAGSVVVAALARAGHRVIGVSARSAASRRRAEVLLPGVPLLAVPDVAGRCDLLVLGYPDDALPALVRELAGRSLPPAGTLVVHHSGRFGVGVLEPLTRAGALPLAIHPAMTLSGAPTDLVLLAEAAFGVTAPEPLRLVAEALVIEMGGEPVAVPEESRPLYHAALAGSANHLVTLVAAAVDLLDRGGVAAAARVLGPLLHAAVDGALDRGDSALTGPVVRGDARTVLAHLRTLHDVAPETVPSYVALARLTADRAIAAGLLPPGGAQGLLEALAADGPKR